MGDGPERFRVIEGGGRPKPYRKRRRGDAEPLVCPHCGSNASVEVKLGRMIRDGKPEGGTKQIRCADCRAVLV